MGLGSSDAEPATEQGPSRPEAHASEVLQARAPPPKAVADPVALLVRFSRSAEEHRRLHVLRLGGTSQAQPEPEARVSRLQAPRPVTRTGAGPRAGLYIRSGEEIGGGSPRGFGQPPRPARRLPYAVE